MLDVVIRRIARTDLLDASRYLVETASAEIAERFLNLAFDSFDKLADNPGMGAARAHPNPRLTGLRIWRFRPYPYLILYRTTQSTVEVLRVVHGARDIDLILRGYSLDDTA